MAAATSSNILNATHLQKLNDSLAQLKEAERELQLAQRSGLTTTVQGQSVADYAAKIADLQAKLLAVKNTYFPNAS